MEKWNLLRVARTTAATTSTMSTKVATENSSKENKTAGGTSQLVQLPYLNSLPECQGLCQKRAHSVLLGLLGTFGHFRLLITGCEADNVRKKGTLAARLSPWTSPRTTEQSWPSGRRFRLCQFSYRTRTGKIVGIWGGEPCVVVCGRAETDCRGELSGIVGGVQFGPSISTVLDESVRYRTRAAAAQTAAVCLRAPTEPRSATWAERSGVARSS